MVFPTTSWNFRNGPRPEPIYGVVVGLYGCAFLIPLGAIAVAGILTNVIVFTLGAFATVTVVTAVVGLAVTRIPGLAVEIGRYRRLWALWATPGALFLLLSVGAETGITPWSVDSVVGWSLLGMVAGTLLGGVVVMMSRTRYANARLSDETDLAQWEGRLPRRRRRIVTAITGVGCLCVPVGLGAQELFGYEWGFALGQMAFTASLVVDIGRPNGRTYHVTDAGMAVEHPFARRLRPWSVFTGYTLTDDALLIHTAQWWRPTLRCDADEIEGIDRVTDALGAQLSESGRVAKQ